jgi:hypothetical protein
MALIVEICQPSGHVVTNYEFAPGSVIYVTATDHLIIDPDNQVVISIDGNGFAPLSAEGSLNFLGGDWTAHFTLPNIVTKAKITVVLITGFTTTQQSINIGIGESGDSNSAATKPINWLLIGGVALGVVGVAVVVRKYVIK